MAGSGQLTVRGLVPDMPLIFNVDEFHFTSPAEHIIDGQRYDLEMQIVHTIQTDYLPREPKLITKKLIVSVLFQNRAGANNTFINSLSLNSLDFIPHLGLDKLMQTLNTQFIFYEGSLSRPPCTENVYRIVYYFPQPISTDQLRYFTSYYQQNYRDVQDTGGRAVLRVTRVVYNSANHAFHCGLLGIILILITVFL